MASFVAPPNLQVLVTCEHASRAVPKPLADLGLSAAVLRSHRGWDPGALGIARTIAAALGTRPLVGRWSRLVADLNRSASNPGVVPGKVDGRTVPGNQLDAAALATRLQRYWLPYRLQVERMAQDLAERGPLLHLSVHSFVERLGGVDRHNDIGLLCDPARIREVALCRRLAALLRRTDLAVRRNFPYFGNTDGLTTHLRGLLPQSRYLGIEVECNQRRVRTLAGEQQVAAALVAALRDVTLPAGASVRRRDRP